jgi:sec-independent protein translocase protein TatA
MGALSLWHWVVIIVVIVILFGGSLLPRLGRFFGKSVINLKDGFKESTDEFKSAVTKDQPADKVEKRDSDSTDGAPKS